MAVGNYKCRMEVAMLGKRFLNHILPAASTPLSLSSPFLRRSLHGSVYDKNVEEEVIASKKLNSDPPQPEEEYWAPDPETGVFVPASEQNHSDGENGNYHCGGSSGSTTHEGSVLEEKAFFRPLEDLETPPPHPFTGEAPPHHFTEELTSYTVADMTANQKRGRHE